MVSIQDSVPDGGINNGVRRNHADESPDGIGQAYTEMICNATGPNAPPRLRTVVADLIRHFHAFVRDNEITMAEWLAAINLVNEAGQMSDAKRNETQFFGGIFGVETLLDRMQDANLEHAGAGSLAPPTSSNLIGPFYQSDSQMLDRGASIVLDGSDEGNRVHMYGRVLDSSTLQPVAGAELDVWHSNAEGLYAQQDPSQPHLNLRGRFLTDHAGCYNFYCSRPRYYPIPDDGPAGKFLRMLDRHPFRPAHIHFIVKAEGYDPLTTELFDSECNYIQRDCMYAVKESLKVDFIPTTGSERESDYMLEFDFHLRKQSKHRSESANT